MSGCSSLTTHPQQLDELPLAGSDLLIFTGLTQAPTCSPDNMLAEFCSCIGEYCNYDAIFCLNSSYHRVRNIRNTGI